LAFQDHPWMGTGPFKGTYPFGIEVFALAEQKQSFASWILSQSHLFWTFCLFCSFSSSSRRCLIPIFPLFPVSELSWTFGPSLRQTHFQRAPLQMVFSQPWSSWLVASLKYLPAPSFCQLVFSFRAWMPSFWCS
jgi:hypothetical protein